MRLRDGKKTGVLLLAALLLTGCGGAADTVSNVEMGDAADDTTTAAADTTTTAVADTATSIEDNWTVVPLASAQELVPYSCTEFSMNIPEGWSVKSSAMYTGMFHAIHVFDPENPVNQIFFMLKMEPMFPDENSHSYECIDTGSL